MKRIMKFAALAILGALTAGAVELEDVTPVEYIASSGTQYIDLGIVGGGDLEVETRMQWVEVPQDNCFLGARKDSGATRYFMINRSKAQGWYIGYGYYYGSSPKAAGDLALTDYYITTVLMAGQQTMTVNGTQVCSQTVAGPITTGYNLYLFGANYYGTHDLKTSARCYYLKFYDRSNGGRQLIADMIPCLDSQDRPGLYDKIRKQVYLGAGTGTLSYRAFKQHPAVKDYDVEYIESTGVECIDTELATAQGYGAETDFAFTEIPSDGCMLGGRGNNSRLYLAYYYNNTFHYGNGSLVPLEPPYPTTVGTRNLVKTEIFSDKRVCTINGTEQSPVYTSVNANWGVNSTIYAFALNNGGNIGYYVKAKCYGIKIWKTTDNTINGERILLRDYHPCVTTDGNAALYDTVSGNVFENDSGNGAFIAGPRIAAGGVVVTGTAGDSIGSMNPAAGRTSEGLTVGTEYTYAADRFYTDDLGNIYECTGYTTSTSTDGVVWNAESAVVNELSMNHVFDGSWWRITWQWSRVGRKLTALVPEGANVTFSPASSEGMPAGYFYDDTEVELTASANDGGERDFYCWYEIYEDASHNEVFDFREHECITTQTVDRLSTLTAVYVGPWVIDNTKHNVNGDETVVSNGNWTVMFKADPNNDNHLTLHTVSKGVGILDFTDIETDTGITADRSWDFVYNSGHKGPVYATEVIAPDLTYVGALTFNNCKNYLKKVTLSPDVTHVGRSAFCYCYELSSLTPSLNTILNQVILDGTELYAYYDCTSLTNDIVIARRDDFTIPPLYLSGLGAKNIDMSGCRGTVSFDAISTDFGFDKKDQILGWSCAIGGLRELVSCTLPPKMNEIAYGIFFGKSVSNDKQTEIKFSGTLPPPEHVAYFYGNLDATVTLFIDTSLNPDVVTDFQLRAPTDQEIALSTFPKAAYDAGKFLGVWDTPTSGWGGPLGFNNPPNFKRMWVVDWKSPCRKKGMTIIVY